MKILLINDIGTATGGAEFQILSLRQGLRDLGHDVRLFSSLATPVADSKLLADYSCFGTNTLLQVLSQTANPNAYFKLRQILKEFKPDVVHVRMFMWQISPLILPLLKNIPCIYQTAVYKAICPAGTKVLPDGKICQDDPGIACLNNGCLTVKTWMSLMVQRQLWQQWQDTFDLVVALSHGMKEQLENWGIKSVEVVHNGVPQRPVRPPLENPPTVAYAGRLVSEKGIETLIRAFAIVLNKVSDAILLIAGDGKEKENLQALTTELGIAKSIKWLGHVSQAEMEQQFNSAWVQVVPSEWEEPFGNVTTEAMMRGTAVIASAVGAQPEIIVDRQTGYLFPPGDVAELTQLLTSLLSNRQLATEIGLAGRDRALSEFSEDKRDRTFLEIYTRLIAQYSAKDRTTETLSLKS